MAQFTPKQENAAPFRKEDITLRIVAKDEDGNPLDLTGGTLRFWLATSWGAAVATISKTITEAPTVSGQIDDPANGRALIKIADTDTAALDIHADTGTIYYGSVALLDAAGELTTIQWGEWRFLKERQPLPFP